MRMGLCSSRVRVGAVEEMVITKECPVKTVWLAPPAGVAITGTTLLVVSAISSSSNQQIRPSCR